jgi:hypothetical protein
MIAHKYFAIPPKVRLELRYFRNKNRSFTLYRGLSFGLYNIDYLYAFVSGYVESYNTREIIKNKSIKFISTTTDINIANMFSENDSIISNKGIGKIKTSFENILIDTYYLYGDNAIMSFEDENFVFSTHKE